MGYVDIERIERQVRLIQDELAGAALVQPDLWSKIKPWMGGYRLDIARLDELMEHVKSADEGWTPARFVDHGIQRLERLVKW